jgi:hypothetical protein
VCLSHRVDAVLDLPTLFCAPQVALAHVESRLPVATGILGRLLYDFPIRTAHRFSVMSVDPHFLGLNQDRIYRWTCDKGAKHGYLKKKKTPHLCISLAFCTVEPSFFSLLSALWLHSMLFMLCGEEVEGREGKRSVKDYGRPVIGS